MRFLSDRSESIGTHASALGLHKPMLRTSYAPLLKFACLAVALGHVVFAADTAVGFSGGVPPPVPVRASQAGAKLDADLLKGGGTDDTAVLQRLLDRAKDGAPVHVIVDGPAVVRGLEIYGNTVLEFTAGAGLYLEDHADRALLRNAHRSRGTIIDEHISIIGGFLNGNRDGQQLVSPKRQVNQEADGSFKTVMQFFGVNYLTIRNTTIWDGRSFGLWVGNANHIEIQNIAVDSNYGPYPGEATFAEQKKFLDRIPRSNCDGLHFNGPIQYLTIDGARLRTEDDSIALNANDSGSSDMTIDNDMGPYVGQGPITDIVIRNVQFMDTLQGFRLLSTDQRIDRVVIDHVTGTVRHRFAILSHFINQAAFGNFGSIVFDHINVNPTPSGSWLEIYPDKYERQPRTSWSKWDLSEEGDLPLFSLNSPVEHLALRHVALKAVDSRPIIRVGADAAIDVLEADISLSDPANRAVPLKLLPGGRIKHWEWTLDWNNK